MTEKERVTLSKIVLPQVQGVKLNTLNTYDADDMFVIRDILTLTTGISVDALAKASFGINVYQFYSSFFEYIEKTPVEHLLTEFDTFFYLLIRNIDKIENKDFRFKGEINLSRYYFTVVLVKLIEQYANECDYTSLSLCLSFFRYPTRMPVVRMDLEEKAWRDYCQIEDNMARVNNRIRKFSFPSLQAARHIVEKFFDFRVCTSLQSHGSGSVAQGRLSLFEKECLLAPIPAARWSGYAIDSSARPSPARIAFVPKSYKAVRTIAMEDVSLVYFQRNFSESFRTYCEKHLPENINFSNQDIYRVKTQKGSKDNSYATIDVSAASDSVSYELVNYLFGRTNYWGMLEQYRNRYYTYTSPQGVRYLGRFQKYAAMGSRLCFPIETIVFATAAQIACRRAFGETAFGGQLEDFTVYGDDVILPVQAAPLFMEILEEWGFSINRDKSFYSQEYFRESCGFFFYKGHQLLLPVCSRFFTPKRREEHVNGRGISAWTKTYGPSKLIPLYNEMYQVKAKTVCTLLRNVLPQVSYTSTVGDSTRLFSPNPNYGVSVTELPELQKVTIRTYRPRSKYRVQDEIYCTRHDERLTVDLLYSGFRSLDQKWITPADIIREENLRGHWSDLPFRDRLYSLIEKPIVSWHFVRDEGYQVGSCVFF